MKQRRPEPCQKHYPALGIVAVVVAGYVLGAFGHVVAVAVAVSLLLEFFVLV